MTARNTALSALAAGLSVCPPVEDGSKRPEPEDLTRDQALEIFGADKADEILGGAATVSTWKHRQIDRANREQIEEWYSGGRTGFGIVTGQVSGNLEMLEFEAADVYQSFKDTAEAAGLGDTFERIARGYSESTPGGGVHLPYHCSEIAGSTKLAQRPGPPGEDGKPTRKVKIETRGEGGYFIGAPSNGRAHPSGGQYRLLRGGVLTIATITPEERSSLFELARAFDEMPKTGIDGRDSVPNRQGVVGGDRPGDRFNASATWDDVLAPLGWAFVYQRGDTTYWRRPGKDRGISATTNWQGSDLLYVFSTSTEFDSERGYSKFGAYAILNHGGDFAAAARTIGRAPVASLHANGHVPPESVGIVDSHSLIPLLTKGENEKLDKSEKPAGFTLTPLATLLKEPEESVRYLVDEMLPAGGISLCAAKPKVGKSTLVRNLVLAVARGAPFLGRVTMQGPVVYLGLEEKRAEARRHFEAMGGIDELVLVHTGAAPAEAVAALHAAIRAHNPVLVVIDPILKLVRLRDANDYAEVSFAMEPLIEMAHATGCHILCVHHLGKQDRTGGDAILGSTALFGAVDTALLMRRHEGRRTLATIQRYGEDLAETVITLDPATGLVSAAGDVATIQMRTVGDQILQVLAGDAVTEADIRERVGGNGGVVGKALRDLLSAGQVERSGAGRRGDPYLYQARPSDSLSPFSIKEGNENKKRLALEDAETGSCAVCGAEVFGYAEDGTPFCQAHATGPRGDDDLPF